MYRVKWQDQYGNIDQMQGAYVSVSDAIASADYLYETRKDYDSVTVVHDRTGEVAHEYKRPPRTA